jgi:hypothetical protein
MLSHLLCCPPQELLEFVASYHMLLDTINLVTCLYRLAKMSFSHRIRSVYLAELQRSPTFQLLLREWSGSRRGRAAGGAAAAAPPAACFPVPAPARGVGSSPHPVPAPYPVPAPTPPRRASLLRAPAGSISAQFLHAQLQWMQHHVEPKGVDARCLANLVWALAKLDLSSDEAALSTEIALNAAPFVLRCLNGSSPQVRLRGA